MFATTEALVDAAAEDRRRALRRHTPPGERPAPTRHRWRPRPRPHRSG